MRRAGRVKNINTLSVVGAAPCTLSLILVAFEQIEVKGFAQGHTDGIFAEWKNKTN